jgi:uncharacterized peroxidase-related enzyme
MQRIESLTIDKAPDASKPVLEAINGKFRKVPNIFAALGNSPAALKTLTGIFASLDEGSLSGKPHEAVALRVGEMHGCKYCTAAHTAKAQMAGATEEETIAYRKGIVDDPKLQSILDLAVSMVENRGKVTDEDVQACRDNGVTDAELLEIVAIVACNTYTNYINGLVLTEVDFPAAPSLD